MVDGRYEKFSLQYHSTIFALSQFYWMSINNHRVSLDLKSASSGQNYLLHSVIQSPVQAICPCYANCETNDAVTQVLQGLSLAQV